MWQYFRFTVSLNKNLLQSEKALQTVDMEFNTRNAFAPRKGNIVRPEKEKCEEGTGFCGYTLFGESGTMHIWQSVDAKQKWWLVFWFSCNIWWWNNREKKIFHFPRFYRICWYRFDHLFTDFLQVFILWKILWFSRVSNIGTKVLIYGGLEIYRSNCSCILAIWYFHSCTLSILILSSDALVSLHHFSNQVSF